MAKHIFTIHGKSKSGKDITYKASTLIPEGGAAKGSSHSYRTIAAEFQARYLSGNRYSGSKGTNGKLETALNHFDAYMMRKEGLKSGDSIKKAHVERFEQFLKTQPSLLSGKMLEDKSLKDVLGNVRKILIKYEKGHMLKETYSAMGLKVSHKDLERPIAFTPDYDARRDAYQDKLEHHRTTWFPIASQLGRVFALREAERLASRDVIEYREGKYYATHKLGPMKEVTVKQLQNRYGNTIDKRLKPLHSNPGLRHLCVEEAKGDRNRFVPVNTPEREAALQRTHDFIRSRSDNRTHMKIHPDKQSPEKAENAYSKMQTRYGATVPSQLHSHGDRHREAQRIYAELRAAGLDHKTAATEVTAQMGHDDPRKIDYYVAKVK